MKLGQPGGELRGGPARSSFNVLLHRLFDFKNLNRFFITNRYLLCRLMVDSTPYHNLETRPISLIMNAIKYTRVGFTNSFCIYSDKLPNAHRLYFNLLKSRGNIWIILTKTNFEGLSKGEIKVSVWSNRHNFLSFLNFFTSTCNLDII